MILHAESHHGVHGAYRSTGVIFDRTVQTCIFDADADGSRRRLQAGADAATPVAECAETIQQLAEMDQKLEQLKEESRDLKAINHAQMTELKTEIITELKASHQSEANELKTEIAELKALLWQLAKAPTEAT